MENPDLLTACPACAAKVSRQSEKCPTCGHVMPIKYLRARRTRGVCAIVFSAFTVGGILMFLFFGEPTAGASIVVYGGLSIWFWYGYIQAVRGGPL
jgi:hypothetical protein